MYTLLQRERQLSLSLLSILIQSSIPVFFSLLFDSSILFVLLIILLLATGLSEEHENKLIYTLLFSLPISRQQYAAFLYIRIWLFSFSVGTLSFFMFTIIKVNIDQSFHWTTSLSEWLIFLLGAFIFSIIAVPIHLSQFSKKQLLSILIMFALLFPAIIAIIAFFVTSAFWYAIIFIGCLISFLFSYRYSKNIVQMFGWQ